MTENQDKDVTSGTLLKVLIAGTVIYGTVYLWSAYNRAKMLKNLGRSH